MAAMTLTIGGVDRTGLLRPGSLDWTDELNSRNTCSFELMDPAGAFRPQVGQEVIVRDGSDKVFAGTIDRFEEAALDWPVQGLAFQVECVDYNQVADRHLVAKVYANMTAGAIVRDLVATALAAEGLSTTGVADGPVVARAVFNYQTVTQCFNDLADLTGYAWWIDYDKVVHFVARDAYKAPWSISEQSRPYSRLSVTTTREQYRNRQYIRAGMDTTDVRTETFKGNGDARSFTLVFPVAEVPTVTVNGVAQTVGIRGLDKGKDWYWNKGEKEITQDDSAARLTASDTLAVTYRGLFPIIMSASTDSDVAARAALEGGSGLYEAIEDNQAIDSASLARQRAEGLLRKYGRIPRTVTFTTKRAGLKAGQLIRIDLPAHALAGDFLIESIQGNDVQGKVLEYRVKALDGESLGGWADFFVKLGQAGRKFVIRENEVLTVLRRFPEVVLVGDRLTVTWAPVGVASVDSALVGFAEVS